MQVNITFMNILILYYTIYTSCMTDGYLIYIQLMQIYVYFILFTHILRLHIDVGIYIVLLMPTNTLGGGQAGRQYEKYLGQKT